MRIGGLPRDSKMGSGQKIPTTKQAIARDKYRVKKSIYRKREKKRHDAQALMAMFRGDL